MKDFLPHFPRQKEFGHSGAKGKDTGAAGGAFGSPLGLEEYAPMLPFLEAFWRRLHEAVDYPDDFAKQRIEGKVWVKVVVDERGVLRDEFLRIESEHAWLRAYVLGILLRVLKEPLPQRRWARRGPVRLSLLFDFQTFADSKFPPADTEKYVGAAMNFQRKALVEPLVFEKFEQLTQILPPILPLNGGFIVDFVRLYRMINSYAGPTELELRKERLKLFKERAKALFR